MSDNARDTLYLSASFPYEYIADYTALSEKSQTKNLICNGGITICYIMPEADCIKKNTIFLIKILKYMESSFILIKL